MFNTVMALIRGGEHEPKLRNRNQKNFQVLLREAKGETINEDYFFYFLEPKLKKISSTLEGGER